MPFDQQLRLIAIGVGLLFIVAAVIIAILAEEGGCFAFILAFVGIVFLVFGFTGDTAALQRQIG